MGTYGGWVDANYNQGVPTGGSVKASFSGTLEVPEVKNGYDPCGTEKIALEPVSTKRKTTTTGGSGSFKLQVPIEVDEGAEPSSIMLRPISGGVEIKGCNFTGLDCCADKVENNDSYYKEGEVSSWQIERPLGFYLASYASGVIGDRIYMFGGVNEVWSTSNKFYVYNVKTKSLTELPNGGLTVRTDAYGWCDGTHFFLYGGYSASLYNPNSFLHTFHRYHIHSRSWTEISVPNLPLTNKLIGGAGKLYIAHAMEVGATGWDANGSCWVYNINDNTWGQAYNGFDYNDEEGWINFNTFVFHQDIIYYFNESKLMKILPYQDRTTEGVTLPNFAHNSSMASWGKYIIFSHGLTDGGAGQVQVVSWFDTSNRLFGQLQVVGDIPQATHGFNIHIIDDVLYVIGGINFRNHVENKVWSLRLAEFFANMPTECLVGVPADTFREKVGYACQITPTHPCPPR